VCAMTARILSRYASEHEVLLSAENGLPPEDLEKTLDFIDQNLQRRITAQRLARMTGLGAAQVARLVKRTMYTTLHQYIMSRRIERARQMLTETNMAIVDIAQDCGFADQVHLTRLFGRMTGTTPALFRRKSKDYLGEGTRSLP